MDQVLQRLSGEAEPRGRASTPRFRALLNLSPLKGEIQLPLRALQKPKLYLKRFLHLGRLLFFSSSCGSGYAGASCRGDASRLLRSCARKTASSLAEAALRSETPPPPHDLKHSVCLAWSCLHAPRSISTCIFVLLRAGRPHWLSPSIRSRMAAWEGQAVQDT